MQNLGTNSSNKNDNAVLVEMQQNSQNIENNKSDPSGIQKKSANSNLSLNETLINKINELSNDSQLTLCSEQGQSLQKSFTGVLKKSKRKASILLDEQYFQEDDEFILSVEQQRKLKNYSITFNILQLIKFFVIHFTYFLILGPFVVLLIKLRYGSIALAQNLYFWNKHYLTMFQTTQYVMTLVIYILFSKSVLGQTPTTIYAFGEFIFYVAVWINRTAMISIKYATFDSVYVDSLNDIPRCSEQFSQLFMNSWVNQTDQLIHDEIYYVLRKYDLDEQLFFIEFMVPLSSQKLKSELAESLESMKVFHKQNSTFIPTSMAEQISVQYKNDPNYVKEFIYGYSIIQKLIIVYQVLNSYKLKIIFAVMVIYCLLRVHFGCFVRFFNDQAVYGKDAVEIICLILINLNVFYVYLLSYLIMIYGINDLKRQQFLLAQLGMMISPRKVNRFQEQKYFPTINLFSPTIMHGWMHLRKVVQNYGVRYNARSQAVSIFLLVLCIGGLVLIMIDLFDVIQLDNVFLGVLFVDTSFIIIIFLTTIYNGASINFYFDDHRNFLMENRTTLQNIYYHQEQYLANQKNSFYYNIAIQRIKNQVDLSKDTVDHYLKNLIQCYSEIILDLQAESDFHAFQILGIKLTFPIFQSLFLGLVTALGYIVWSSIQSRVNDKIASTTKTF